MSEEPILRPLSRIPLSLLIFGLVIEALSAAIALPVMASWVDIDRDAWLTPWGSVFFWVLVFGFVSGMLGALISGPWLRRGWLRWLTLFWGVAHLYVGSVAARGFYCDMHSGGPVQERCN